MVFVKKHIQIISFLKIVLVLLFNVFLGVSEIKKQYHYLQTNKQTNLFSNQKEKEENFGDVALSIVRILETFRRRHLAENSHISMREVKNILRISEFGLGSYLSNFKNSLN